MPNYFSLSTKNFLGKQFSTWNDSSKDSKSINLFLDVGLRYESRLDYRLEYIFNQYGLSSSEVKNISSALIMNNPFALYNARILAKRGSEFIGSRYIYQSLRLPDIGPRNKGTAYLRHTLSLQDHTSNVLLSFDYELGNRWIWYLESQTFVGPSRSEFSSEGRLVINIGPKYSF
jgi:hypothetical protein